MFICNHVRLLTRLEYIMKEVIKVIKNNITFNKLPKDIQKAWIDGMARTMIMDFDDGVYNLKTASIDAKKYYLDWEKDRKYVLYNSSFFGLQAEEQESVKRAIADGVDLVTFSGDKLLGGVQAGFIVGKKSLVQNCRNHPLYRALRCCKLTYAALESLLILYERCEQREIPVWKMLEKTEQECRQQAEEILHELKGLTAERKINCSFSIQGTKNYSGGGALPAESLESCALVWKVKSVEAISRELRTGQPSVLARIHDDSLYFEMRTILNQREREILRDRIIEILDKMYDG